jgi:hypothetical protein
MGTVVNYPVEVKSYKVFIGRDGSEVLLEGVERHPDALLRAVGRFTFRDPSRVQDKDFINRGGFLQMDRPSSLFPQVLDLLRNEQPLYLMGNGMLATSPEPIGEEEGG